MFDFFFYNTSFEQVSQVLSPLFKALLLGYFESIIISSWMGQSLCQVLILVLDTSFIFYTFSSLLIMVIDIEKYWKMFVFVFSFTIYSYLFLFLFYLLFFFVLDNFYVFWIFLSDVFHVNRVHDYFIFFITSEWGLNVDCNILLYFIIINCFIRQFYPQWTPQKGIILHVCAR